MSDENTTVNFVSSTDEIIGQQNIQAATSIIDFRSAGHCLVIGDTDAALASLEKLGELKCTVVTIDPEMTAMEKRLTEAGVTVFNVPNLKLSGYLGAYSAHVEEPTGSTDLAVSVYLESGAFDLVLDLNESPLMDVALPPLGYFRGHTAQQLSVALAELPDLVGEFEKPKYFDYNASICAHSRSELIGCNACVSACATGAITSAGEGVEVDPYLCQGCGSCATVCPSGAMTYAYPKPDNAIDRTRDMLRDGKQHVLLLHSEHQQSIADEFDNNEVLSLLVEEVSAFGMDYWASMIGAGVHRILLLTDNALLEQTRLAIQSQMDVFHQLLSGLGIVEPVIEFIAEEELQALDLSSLKNKTLTSLTPSSFTTHNNKRQTLRSAIDVLSEQLPPINKTLNLQAPAPFGLIEVEKSSCTLCMACVSVCPGKALLDGQDTPALRIIEANCLQCGLCDAACPESAITLAPQYTYDSIEARKIQTLNEEAPFNCVRCQKPFATAKIIQTMFEKLDGHWMFEDEAARRRLKMCEDCRVKDMFESDAAGIDVHKSEKA